MAIWIVKSPKGNSKLLANISTPFINIFFLFRLLIVNNIISSHFTIGIWLIYSSDSSKDESKYNVFSNHKILECTFKALTLAQLHF